MNGIWILLGFVILVVLYLWSLYNGLVGLKTGIEEAWSQIDVQLKRRADLIPNLVETVKGYAKHESETFQKVTQARVEAMQAHSTADQAKSEQNLSAMIGNLLAVAENYPDLKASENFKELQSELSDTENKIQASRRFYNNQALAFNNKLQVFPTNMIGSMLGFKVEEFFEIEDQAQREAVSVKF